jgi:hypothetical protein
MPTEQGGTVVELVLFISMHDASRGPLAAALFNQFACPTRARAYSAGLRPARALSHLMGPLLEGSALVLPPTSPKPLDVTEDLRRATFVVHIGQLGSRRCPEHHVAWDVPTIKPPTLQRALLIKHHLEMRIACLVGERGWAIGTTP